MAKPRIDLVGRLGQDPEDVASGKGVKFSLAVDVGKDLTDWYSVVVWNDYTKNHVRKYFKKGSLAIVGGLQTLAKVEDGKGYYVNIEATSVQFGPSSKKQADVSDNKAVDDRESDTEYSKIPF